MGASPDDDADRKVEKPVDDNWTSGSSIHNDRTTHGLYVDPESVAKLTAGKPDVPEHDRTTIGTGADRIVPAVEPAKKDDSSVVAIDHLMSEMQHDKSAPGLGAGTPAPTPMTPVAPVTPVLRFGGGKIPLEKEHELAQPERSPLSFVMRDMEPSAAPAAPASSGDSSRFIAAFVGDQPSPPVEPAPPPVTSLQPVSRRSRRKLYIAGGALAAAAVLTAGLAIKLTGSDAAPKPTATARVVEAQPQPQPAPQPTQADPLYGATPAAEPVAETPAPQPPAQTETQPVIAKKTVATKDATPKRTAKKTATKTTTAKKTTAKKSTTKKAPTKKTTRSRRSGRRTVR